MTKTAERGWRTTGKDRDNPQPQIYPECETCDTPYVYRRFLSLKTGGYVWAWSRDCKHKNSKWRKVDDRPNQEESDDHPDPA